ncbi:hypothetical protein FXO37_07612 [Capsicum annuum]|nr:hypothetical protein FXO37_07612 [Capsicum annuum]
MLQSNQASDSEPLTSVGSAENVTGLDEIGEKATISSIHRESNRDNNDADAEKFTILYFLHSFVLSNVETVVIPRLHFDLVDSGRYKDFPWGALSFEDLARNLNNRLKADGQFYLIQGMPLAIQVWLYECCSNVPPKILNWKTIAPRPRFEFLMNAMFNDNDKVVFKNIEPTEKELSKLQIPQKDATQHERSVDSDNDFQDPPPKKSNEHSKKKKKVDSLTPVVKKPLRKKQVDSFHEHTQTRTPAPRATKTDGMKTPIFKPIPTRQASSSKTAKGKQAARVIFPQVHSKPDIHVEEVTVSKTESYVDKQAFISKKDFDAFCDEGCIVLHSEKMNVEIDSQQLIPDELLQSIKLDYLHSDKVVQHDCQTSDEKIDETILFDSQFTIPDEMLPSLNVYQIQSIIIHASTNRQEESHHEILDAKTSETVIEDHDQINRGITDSEVELDTEEQVRTPPNIQEVTNDEQRDEKLWPDSQNIIPDEFLPILNVYSQKSIIIHPSANLEVKTLRPKLRIRRPSKFKESPYTKKFNSAAEKCIFLYDSYESNGHYVAVLAEIEKIAKIISLCHQACDFYVKKGIDHQSHPRYKDKESSDMFDVLFQDDLPQQPSGSLNCGVFMVMYAECLSYGHKVIASDYGIRK